MLNRRNHLLNKKVNLFGRSMDLHLIICRGVSLIMIRLVYSENKLLRYCWHFLKEPGHLLLNEDLKKLFWKELDNVDSFMERRNRLITDLRTDLRKIGANLSVTLVNGGYQLHFSLENSKKSVKNQ